MTGAGEAGFASILAELKRRGLLLLHDASLPSVAAAVAGSPVKGSWWAHPRAHDIFHVAGLLEDHPDVLSVKLIAGKVTFVHRSLWPALIAVALSGEDWQTRGLSPAARSLLARVSREGEVRTDRPPRADGKAAGELQRRLLVVAQEFHTETGAHALRLLSWRRWAGRAKGLGRRPAPDRARRILEEAVEALSAARTTPSPRRRLFPWPPPAAGAASSRRGPSRTRR